MKKGDQQSDISRRSFCKFVAGVPFWGFIGAAKLFASEEVIPEEPEFLDEPTSWQEGDPEPTEMEVPEVEPEQSSAEAPPSQPMEDEQPEQPSPDHAWVSGYWWWKNNAYVWVPGYWAIPPRKKYVYVPGYWRYQGSQWVFNRGGWAKPGSTKIVVYAGPRPHPVVFVVTAPRRIIRRHRRWRYYPARRVRRVVRRRNRRIRRREKRRQ